MLALPPLVTEDGLNETVAPDGAPLAVSDTLCALPELVEVETVALAAEPAWTVPVDGFTARVKSLSGVVVPPTEVFQIAYATPSAFRFSTVALMLEVVSQEEW